MKAIMISIQPEWVEKILNKEKTIEIRKTIPKCELPVKVYIYCTKDKTSIPILKDIGGYAGSYEAGGHHSNFVHINKKHFLYRDKERCFFDVLDCDRLPRMNERCSKLNSKVVAEFTLNKVDKYSAEFVDDDCYEDIRFYQTDSEGDEYNYIVTTNEQDNPSNCYLCKESCLSYSQIKKYVGVNFHNYPFYAWHISDLKIYDTPKELNEFRYWKKDKECCGWCCKGKSIQNSYTLSLLTRPPQSYMFVEELEVDNG